MDTEQKKRRHPGIIAAVVIVLMLIAYPLSVGPAAWLVSREMLPEPLVDALEVVYSPLRLLAGNSESFESAYYWYIILWMPDDFPFHAEPDPVSTP